MLNIAVCNQKGGSGKTTTAINVGHCMAQQEGRKTLIVDLDPQGQLAEGFGYSAWELKKEISEVIDQKVRLKDIIINISDKLDIAPANIKLSGVEALLWMKHRREDRLKNALNQLDKSDYDYVLVDCPPSLGLLTVNALSACDLVLIPMTADFYAMLGVSLLLASISQMRQELNPRLKILGLVVCRYTRTTHARLVLDKTREELPELTLYEPPVNESVKFKESVANGKPIIEYAPNIPGALAYCEITKAIVNQLEALR